MRGVYWRGHWWVIAGGSEGSTDENPPAAPEALTAVQGRITELEAAVAASATELAGARARVGELEASAEELEGLRRQVGEADRRALDAQRRALLAEYRGEVVEELVHGATAEELERSVADAKAAYARIADLVRQDLAGQTIPNGAGARRGDGGEGLSALQKIAQGLRK